MQQQLIESIACAFEGLTGSTRSQWLVRWRRIRHCVSLPPGMTGALLSAAAQIATVLGS